MNRRHAALAFAATALLGCKQPATDAGVKSLSDMTNSANGTATTLRQCQGKYRAFAGVRPDESAFVGFSDAERAALNTAATAVPGFALYLYAVVLDGQFEIDGKLAECAPKTRAAKGPCAIFKTEEGDFGKYKIVFEKGADKIASHLPFASALMMLNMARYEVKDGKPVFSDLPAAVKAQLEAIKSRYLSEATFTGASATAEVASLKAMPLDFFGAHALDSTLCNEQLAAADGAAYPQTMALVRELAGGFAAVETAFAAALNGKRPLEIPAGLAPLAQRLAENLRAGMAMAGSGEQKGLGLWGKGGVGGGGKVAAGEGPLGRTIYENPTRAAGGGVLNSKADRDWVE